MWFFPKNKHQKQLHYKQLIMNNIHPKSQQPNQKI